MPARQPARAAAPAPPAKTAARTRRILAALAVQHPDADTELHYSNPYELLVATILSAQCTDERVNQVTPALFRRYPDARALARATTAELEPQIQATGFFRAKSRALIGMATALAERHGGEVPASLDALVQLPGVGRKTANVVLGHALGVPGLPVDRHVLRVANRIGIARSEDPEVVERQLSGAIPAKDWTLSSDTLILHGRRICKPRPLCERCAVRDDCDYFRASVGPAARAGLRPTRVKAGRGPARPAAAARTGERAVSRAAPASHGDPSARGRRRPEGRHRKS